VNERVIVEKPGVGSAMLQLARLLSIRMYGTVSAAKMDLVRQLGGTALDYKHSDFVQELRTLEPNGVQAVFDPVGGPQLERSYQVLSRNGTLVMFGTAAAAQARGNATLALAATLLRFLALKLRLSSRHVELYLIEAARKKNPEHFRQDVQTLLELLRDGKITPHIAKVLPLSQAKQAHALLEGARVMGKIILQP